MLKKIYTYLSKSVFSSEKATDFKCEFTLFVQLSSHLIQIANHIQDRKIDFLAIPQLVGVDTQGICASFYPPENKPVLGFFPNVAATVTNATNHINT